MRLATWCIDGVRGRLELLCHWLEQRQPDVMALQKIRAPAPCFPADALRQVGYRSESLCGKGSYGVALLSRRELPNPDVLDRGLPGGDGQDDGLLTARVGDLVVSSVYAPWGDPKTTKFAGALKLKLAWLDRLIAHLAERRMGSERSVLCGDFNVLPDGSDKRCLGQTPEERRRLGALCEVGFADLYRRAKPKAPGCNYGFNPRESPTSRLQLLLGSEDVADSVLAACVDLKYRRRLEELPGGTGSPSAPVIVQA